MHTIEMTEMEDKTTDLETTKIEAISKIEIIMAILEIIIKECLTKEELKKTLKILWLKT